MSIEEEETSKVNSEEEVTTEVEEEAETLEVVKVNGKTEETLRVEEMKTNNKNKTNENLTCEIKSNK